MGGTLEIKELKNVDKLGYGIYKHWIWKEKDLFWRSQDMFQKVNFSIQDLNTEIDCLSSPSMKDVVFVIVLVDWIKEAVQEIIRSLRPEIQTGFAYKKQEELSQAKAYFQAIRSFLVAHPATTNKHQNYGFDGGKICVDIRQKTSALTSPIYYSENWQYLDFSGLKPYTSEMTYDFVAYIYSREPDKMQFFKFIGASFSDLYNVANLYIDELYELGKYLGKLKKKDFEVKGNEQIR